MTVLSSANAGSRMRIAIEDMKKSMQAIFSLIAELEAQGYAADAAAMQTLLTSMQALLVTIQNDVA